MTGVQHEGAEHLLRIIRDHQRRGEPLTYADAAIEMGRSRDHGRAVASMCDLLDAAAALSGRPLLALVAVKTANHKFNKKAWTGKNIPADLRPRIIQKSLDYTFTDTDYRAIRAALSRLSGLGNRAAWDHVRANVPRQRLFSAIATKGPLPQSRKDAIDDIGVDQPQHTVKTVATYERDDVVRKKVLEFASGKCELCGTAGFLKTDNKRYLETHHVIALADDGADRVSNVIALCANHHRQAHFGKNASRLESRMIEILSADRRRQRDAAIQPTRAGKRHGAVRV